MAYTSRSQCAQLEEVVFPGPEIDIEAGIMHLITDSLITFVRQHVAQLPLLSSEVLPRHLHTSLSGFRPKVDDDEVAFILFRPAPGENVPAALIVGPSTEVAKAPLTIAEDAAV